MTPFQTGLLMAICAAWGIHMAVVKVTMELIDPLTYVSMRMAIIALILSPLLRWYPGQMVRIALAGICFGGLNYALMFTGIKLTNASIGSVLTESYVVIATIYGVVFFGEKVGWRRTLGIATAIVGVLIIATAEGDLVGSSNLPLGALLVVLGATSEATGAIFVKKIEGVKPLSLLAWFGVVGCLLTFVLSLIFESDRYEWVSNGSAMPVAIATVYSVFVASIFGHASYYYLLQRVPLSIIAPSGLLITLFAVMAGVWWLGEAFTWRLAMGGLLVLGGVAVVIFRSNKPDRKQIVVASVVRAEDSQEAS